VADPIILDLSNKNEPYNENGVPHRRVIPEESGAMACVGFDWSKIIEILSNEIGKAAPEIKHRQTAWILRARPNGIFIEFYEDDDALAHRLDQQVSITDGPPVHAGRLTWW